MFNKQGHSLIPLIIILGFVFLAIFFLLRSKPTSPHPSSPSPTPLPTKVLDDKIGALISFDLPAGWSKTYTSDDLEITSPDLVTEGISSTHAVTISFEYELNDQKKTVDQVYQGIYGVIRDKPRDNGGYSVSKVTLNGYPAVYQTINVDGYTQTYLVWNGDYIWKIIVSSPNYQSQLKHQPEVKKILSSLKFKS
jgi:hypothetical protein